MYCICKGQFKGSFFLECVSGVSGCGNWFHPECYNLSEKEISRATEDENNLCPSCREIINGEQATSEFSRGGRRVSNINYNYNEDSDDEEEYSVQEMSADDQSDDVYGDDDSDDSVYFEPRTRRPRPERIVRRSSSRNVPRKSYCVDDMLDDMMGSDGEEAENEIDEPVFQSQVERILAMRDRSNEPKVLATVCSPTFKPVKLEEGSATPPPLSLDSEDIDTKNKNEIKDEFTGTTEEEGEITEKVSTIVKEENINKIVNTNGEPLVKEYLVKWKERAYMHCSWLTFEELEEDSGRHAKGKVDRFLKKWNINTPPSVLYGDDCWYNPMYDEIDRIIACTHEQNFTADERRRARMEHFNGRVESRLKKVYLDGRSCAEAFEDPVRDVGYETIIEKPMCLSFIRAKIANHEVNNIQELEGLYSLMFANCRKYNVAEGTQWVIRFAIELEKELEILFHQFHENEAAIIEEDACYSSSNPISDSEEENENSPKCLVKWKGLPYSDCTWEFESDLDPEAVRSFYERNIIHEKKKPDPTKRPRVPGRKRPNLICDYVYPKSPNYNGKRLREYQVEGVNWLIRNFKEGRNVILADEMGLGKTAQTCAFLRHLAVFDSIRGPFLVVAPLSTIEHWCREVDSWAGLNVVMYHDPHKGKESRAKIREYEFNYSHELQKHSGRAQRKRLTGTNRSKKWMVDVLVTSYEVVMADEEPLSKIGWEYIVVDEAQRLKNRAGRLLTTLNNLGCERKLLLSGTPLQNNVTELWSLLNFIEPKSFSNLDSFLDRFGSIDSADVASNLRKRVSKYILRRLKEHVEKNIPPKRETLVDVELSILQKQVYRALYERNRAYLGGSLGQDMPSLINLEIELRKCCNHPFLTKGVEQRAILDEMTEEERLKVTVESSGKLVLLNKLLPKLKAEDHKVLIFSQMTNMLDILDYYCRASGWPVERIDGGVKGHERQQAIDRYSTDPNSFVFLLSTRAGGVGINLTAADTVVIFDSDWNPQCDLQAQARAHRIGQTSEVQIYRFLTSGTYEETMFQKASMKLGLEKAVMSNSQKGDGPSKNEIETLLRRGAYAVAEDEDESHSRSKAFTDANIDDLLERGSRVIQYNSSSDSSFNFARTTFKHKCGVDVDVDDPEFWDKVIGKDWRETLQQQITSSNLRSKANKRKFMADLQNLVNEIIQAKLSGIAKPKFEISCRASLNIVVSKDKLFTESETQQAAKWLREMERPTRKRRTAVMDENGQVSYCSDDEDEDYEEPISKAAAKANKIKQKKAAIAAESKRKATKKRKKPVEKIDLEESSDEEQEVQSEIDNEDSSDDEPPRKKSRTKTVVSKSRSSRKSSSTKPAISRRSSKSSKSKTKPKSNGKGLIELSLERAIAKSKARANQKK